MKRLPLVLDGVGLMCVALAAFMVAVPLGFAVVGGSLFLLSWMLERDA